ncbi:MAG TPA: hypothetical protein VFN67_33370 [Polyangiales bacterium]|nr:hypothetical protein [Polyangiales bacterium]
MSDKQVSTGHENPNEPPRSPLKLLIFIALALGAIVVFGALDH